MNDEKKYTDLIKRLKKLQQVKAPPNFETNLKRKINEGTFEEKSKRSIKDFLIPSRLIPSFGLAAVVVVVFLLVNTTSEEAENPFMIEPKVREDIITVEEVNLLKVPDGSRSTIIDDANEKNNEDRRNKELRKEGMYGDNLPENNIIAESESFLPDSTLTDKDEIEATDDYSSPSATGLAIKRSGLNFRQINPTDAEQKEIMKLKRKIQIRSKKTDIE